MNPLSIVVTGAAGGIGSAIVKILAAEGHNLTTADIEQDVRDTRAMVELADTAVVAFGRLDVWLHTAGRGIDRGPAETTCLDLLTMTNVNAWGAINAVNACLPHFRAAKRGQFIAITSALVHDIRRSRHRFAYTISKAAMEQALDMLQTYEWDTGFPLIWIESVGLPGVDTGFSRNALHASGGVSSSPSLLSAEEAACEVIAAIKWETLA